MKWSLNSIVGAIPHSFVRLSFCLTMTHPKNFKSVKLYLAGWSVRAIKHSLGYTREKVLRHLELAGVELDPSRETTRREYIPPPHLIGVAGLSDETAKFLSKNQPQTPEQEAAFDREIKEACDRVRPRAMARRAMEESHA